MARNQYSGRVISALLVGEGQPVGVLRLRAVRFRRGWMLGGRVQPGRLGNMGNVIKSEENAVQEQPDDYSVTNSQAVAMLGVARKTLYGLSLSYRQFKPRGRKYYRLSEIEKLKHESIHRPSAG